VHADHPVRRNGQHFLPQQDAVSCQYPDVRPESGQASGSRILRTQARRLKHLDPEGLGGPLDGRRERPAAPAPGRAIRPRDDRQHVMVCRQRPQHRYAILGRAQKHYFGHHLPPGQAARRRSHRLSSGAILAQRISASKRNLCRPPA